MKKITKSLLLISLASYMVACSPKQEITYKVVFKNYDDSVLYETTVKKGQSVTYEGENPTKPADLDNYYEFKEWDTPLDNVTSDLEIKATFDSVSNIADFSVDFVFTVDMNASEYNADTTNYLGVDEGVEATLVKSVIVDEQEVTTRTIKFDDMTFDYSQVDLSIWDEFPISLTYAGITKTDIIDVLPSYHDWNNDRHYDFGGKYVEPGPDWLIITYLDLFDEGAMINGYPGEFIGDYYHYELSDEVLRIYGKYDGGTADVLYLFIDSTLHQYNRLGEKVDTIHCVVDNPISWVAPSEFALDIYKSFDESTSEYGTASGDNKIVTPKYDYDPANKSIRIHLPDYPNPFVYDESDGKYHA